MTEQDPIKAMIREQTAQRRRRPLVSAFHLLLPLLALGIGALVVNATTGNLAGVTAAMGVAFFTLGKLIIVMGLDPESTFKLDVWALAATVIYMDLVVAYVFAFNLYWVFRVPKLGPAVYRIQNFCKFVLATRPWMRRWAFTGVFLFVMIPITGTGAPAAAILGRIVGIGPLTTFIATAIGSIAGCTLLALFAAPLGPVIERIREEWWFQAAGFALIGVLLFLLYRLGRRLNRAVDAYMRSQDFQA